MVSLWIYLEWSPIGSTWNGLPLDLSEMVSLWIYLEWSPIGSTCNGLPLDLPGMVSLWIYLEWSSFGSTWNGLALDCVSVRVSTCAFYKHLQTVLFHRGWARSATHWLSRRGAT